MPAIILRGDDWRHVTHVIQRCFASEAEGTGRWSSPPKSLFPSADGERLPGQPPPHRQIPCGGLPLLPPAERAGSLTTTRRGGQVRCVSPPSASGPPFGDLRECRPGYGDSVRPRSPPQNFLRLHRFPTHWPIILLTSRTESDP